MTEVTPIRLAIIGGGLAGASLANALVSIKHVDILLYESAPTFSERGAAVGLAVNAQNALSDIMSTEATAFLKGKAGGVSMNSTRIMMVNNGLPIYDISVGADELKNLQGAGPATGDLVFDLAGTDPGIVIHRASILRELLAPLPERILHANKQLAKIDENDTGVELTFKDGTVAHFDAVIGADGIFSTVRQHVSEDSASDAPSAAGFWDCRNVVPFSKAESVLGKEYFALDRQYGWVGPGALAMHDVLEDRTMVQCVVSAVEKDPPKDRKRPLTQEFMSKTFADWPDSPIAKGITKLVLDQPNPTGYSQWEHKNTSTYSRGRVCVIGDAAHAITPWQGSGAGMALEDAAVLKCLLANVTSPGQIEAAFAAYSAVRMPRCQRIIDSSRETGDILCGQSIDAGLDPTKLREALGPRWSHIYSLDLEEHKRDAVSKFKEFMAG